MVKTWLVELLERLFEPTEVKLIASLHVSDKLIWHHNPLGIFTVNSGYEIGKYLIRNGELGKKGEGI